MNAWKINTLMNKHFPKCDFSSLSWVNVQGKPEVLETVLKSNITSNDLLISVNRKIGARLSLNEAISFISTEMGQHHIRISNREFTQFFIVGSNCTASGVNNVLS